jgi:nucleotide-binding universal stress UspA family protein
MFAASTAAGMAAAKAAQVARTMNGHACEDRSSHSTAVRVARGTLHDDVERAKNAVMDERRYTVVVGVDASPTGQEALRWALGEARARRGRLRAIHAWMSPYDYQLEVYFPPDEAALHAAAQRRLDEALDGVDVSAVDVEAELIESDPRHVLVDAARDADLLVIGSHGRGRVAEVVLGSVSTFCVPHAPGPVVVVHSRSTA